MSGLESAGLVTSVGGAHGPAAEGVSADCQGRRSLARRQTEWRTFAQAVNGVVEGIA